MQTEKEREQINVFELVHQINRSDFRRTSIPLEMVSGWPCIHRLGGTLCITVPYFTRNVEKTGTLLYPLYCSVTVPVRNPNRIMDFRIYPFQEAWKDVDYTKPVGTFPHPALGEGVQREQYQKMCKELYQYYDEMVSAVEHQQVFQQQKMMADLFSRLMEPGQFPQYLRINRKFYSCFCRLG